MLSIVLALLPLASSLSHLKTVQRTLSHEIANKTSPTTDCYIRGDPHFQTFDISGAVTYDFQGTGIFIVSAFQFSSIEACFGRFEGNVTTTKWILTECDRTFQLVIARPTGLEIYYLKEAVEGHLIPLTFLSPSYDESAWECTDTTTSTECFCAPSAVGYQINWIEDDGRQLLDWYMRADQWAVEGAMGLCQDLRSSGEYEGSIDCTPEPTYADLDMDMSNPCGPCSWNINRAPIPEEPFLGVNALLASAAGLGIDLPECPIVDDDLCA